MTVCDRRQTPCPVCLVASISHTKESWRFGGGLRSHRNSGLGTLTLSRKGAHLKVFTLWLLIFAGTNILPQNFCPFCGKPIPNGRRIWYEPYQILSPSALLPSLTTAESIQWWELPPQSPHLKGCLEL